MVVCVFHKPPENAQPKIRSSEWLPAARAVTMPSILQKTSGSQHAVQHGAPLRHLINLSSHSNQLKLVQDEEEPMSQEDALALERANAAAVRRGASPALVAEFQTAAASNATLTHAWELSRALQQEVLETELQFGINSTHDKRARNLVHALIPAHVHHSQQGSQHDSQQAAAASQPRSALNVLPPSPVWMLLLLLLTFLVCGALLLVHRRRVRELKEKASTHGTHSVVSHRGTDSIASGSACGSCLAESASSLPGSAALHTLPGLHTLPDLPPDTPEWLVHAARVGGLASKNVNSVMDENKANRGEEWAAHSCSVADGALNLGLDTEDTPRWLLEAERKLHCEATYDNPLTERVMTLRHGRNRMPSTVSVVMKSRR